MISARAVQARLAQNFAYQHRILLPRQAIQRSQHVKQLPRATLRLQTTTTAPPPSPRSLSRSILRTIILYTFLGSTAFFLGAYAAISYLPNREALTALFTAKAPSNEETLALYTPPDDLTAAINTRLLNAPIAQDLRASGTFTEARPHLKIPDALKPTNLTAGTLAGPGRITVPPLMFSDGGKTLTTLIHLGPQLCGHPGIIHGGLLATLLDEGLARCCFPALPGKIGVTAQLKIQYKKPVRADRFYAIRAETVKVEGRKAWAKGWIEEVDCEGQVAARGEDGERVRVCEAEGLFVSPKNAELLTKVYRYSGAT